MNYLSILIALPVLGAVVVGALRNATDHLLKQIGVGTALASLLVTISMALQFEPGSSAPLQFVESYDWIPAFGVSFSLGVDGIALMLIVLAAVLVPVVMLAGWNESDGHRGTVRQYVVLTLLTYAMMVGVFAATDVFL